MTIHIVYPHSSSIATPDAIGRRVADRLRSLADVELHHWDSFGRIVPRSGDILIGHPHPFPRTVFRRSMRHPGWARRIVLCPFTTNRRQVAFLDRYVRSSDAFLAITGAYWMEQLASSEVSHWAQRITHLDLAVDRRDFPRCKGQFNPPGARRFLYIGHGSWQKNVEYLNQLAAKISGARFAWMGHGSATCSHLELLGPRDTASVETRELISDFDFMITVGRADANPTTVLEAMSWGLIPVCTPQSGYIGEPGIINIPLDDVDGALPIIDHLQFCDNSELERLRELNDKRIESHYNWERFCEQVEDVVKESEPTRPLAGGSLPQRIRLAAIALTEPAGPLRVSAIARRARRRR